MRKRSTERKRLERLQHNLSVAGNGLFLAGSVAYLSDGTTWMGTLAFVVGSAAALLGGLIPQIARLWVAPREGDGDDFLARPHLGVAPQRLLGAALLVALLAGCSVTVAPNSAEAGRIDVASDSAPSERLHPAFPLTAYPGAEVVAREADDDALEVTFRTDAPVQRVYDHHHAELRGAGWRRTELEREDDEIEAAYARGDEALELELERAGRERLALEVERDD